MEKTLATPDLSSILKQLSLAEVEQRLTELDAERVALSLLRRSLAARDRAKRRRRTDGKGAGNAH